MARRFRFVDMLGHELHIVNDPEEMLPIPRTEQEISIGNSRMLVESVTSVLPANQHLESFLCAFMNSAKRKATSLLLAAVDCNARPRTSPLLSSILQKFA